MTKINIAKADNATAFNSNLGSIIKQGDKKNILSYLQANEDYIVSAGNKKSLREAGVDGWDEEIPVEAKPHDVMIASKYVNKWRDAQRRGIDFDLTLPQFRKLFSRKTCGYTGGKLILGDKDFNPTVERIDSDKGYTGGNVIVVADFYNRLKNTLFECEGSPYLTDMKSVAKMMEKLKQLGAY